MIHQEKDLIESLVLFKKHFSLFVVSLLDPENTGNWEPEFRKALFCEIINERQYNWIKAITGKEPNKYIDCIDFQYFEIFANNRRYLLEPVFKKDIHYLPSWLHEIEHVRNKVFHYTNVNTEDINIAWIYINRIAEIIKDTELQNGLKAIKE